MQPAHPLKRSLIQHTFGIDSTRITIIFRLPPLHLYTLALIHVRTFLSPHVTISLPVVLESFWLS